MDDQHFGDDQSLESLIEQGLVTHLCDADKSVYSDETTLLTALCDAVAGQIYRIDGFTYVFRISETDLDGTLAMVPPETWADRLEGRLRLALLLTEAPEALRIRALCPDAKSGSETSAFETAEGSDTPLESAIAEQNYMIAEETAEELALADADGSEASAETEDETSQTVDDPALPVTEEQSGPVASDETAEIEMDRDPVVASQVSQDEPEIIDLVAASPDEIAEFETEFDAQDAHAEAEQASTTGFEHRLAQIEAMLANSATPEPLAAIEQRLAGVEQTLSELKCGMDAIVQALSVQGAAINASGRLMDDLAQECRKIPERAAHHFSARDDSLKPVAHALTNLLRRLDEAPEMTIDMAPIETALMGMGEAIADMQSRLCAPDSSRIEALADELRALPERAARHVSASNVLLAPMFSALVAALQHLDHQVVTLLQRTPEGAPQDHNADLRLAMAEFLSLLELRLASGTPIT